MSNRGLEHVIGQWLALWEEERADDYPPHAFAEWLEFVIREYGTPTAYRELKRKIT